MLTKTHSSFFTHFGRPARCLAGLTSFRVRNPHVEALDCAAPIAALLDREQSSMPILLRSHSECLNTPSDFPDEASGSEAAHLRIVSPEQTRSEHQANILTIFRLLPVPSIGLHAVVRCRHKLRGKIRLSQSGSSSAISFVIRRDESTMRILSLRHVLPNPGPSSCCMPPIPSVNCNCLRSTESPCHALL
jgi:hypothetical protein